MGGIFISYRRAGTRHAAGRLADRLITAVGRENIFMDVDNIEPGLDFVEVLGERVAACDCLLAVIDPDWLDARSADGTRRLDDPDDFVRIEIEAALKRNVRVIPVLMDGANMPPPERLSEGLRPLVRRQAVKISHDRFAADAGALAEQLKKVVRPAGKRWWGGARTASAATSAVVSNLTDVRQPIMVTPYTGSPDVDGAPKNAMRWFRSPTSSVAQGAKTNGATRWAAIGLAWVLGILFAAGLFAAEDAVRMATGLSFGPTSTLFYTFAAMAAMAACFKSIGRLFSHRPTISDACNIGLWVGIATLAWMMIVLLVDRFSSYELETDEYIKTGSAIVFLTLALVRTWQMARRRTAT
jgi:TIR domain